MWRGPTGGSVSRRSCGTSGGGGSGCCGSCYWLWIVGGVKWPGWQQRRTEHPKTSQGSHLSPQERQDDGGDERGVSEAKQNLALAAVVVGVRGDGVVLLQHLV